jgi:hypothetical protein
MGTEAGRAEIWFKATHAGSVSIQAESPASSFRRVKQVQLATPVSVTIN